MNHSGGVQIFPENTSRLKGEKKPDGDSLHPFPRVISVSSGKGGVGKTNVVANLALAFSQQGKRVCILDNDLGAGSLQILLGTNVPYIATPLFESTQEFTDLLIRSPWGVLILPLSPAILDSAGGGENRKLFLLSELDRLADQIDILLIDAGTGISSDVLFFNIAAQEMISVVTPDPTSVIGTHAQIKILATRYLKKEFSILVNQAADEGEALRIFEALHGFDEDFPSSLSLDYMGFVPFDEKISLAGQSKKPVLELFPHCPSSRRFKKLAEFFLGKTIRKKGYENVQFFRNRLFRYDN
jgi:flagellar biosynthesis protein FlhG